MKNGTLILIGLLFVCSACFSGRESFVVQHLTPKKQKQKIAHLQKKLEIAEKEKHRTERNVEDLTRQLDEAQMVLIQREVDDYERCNDPLPKLFIEEREVLYRMIRSGPSPTAVDAHNLLDRILRMITELSNEETSRF